MTDHYQIEEEFHSKDNKSIKRERKRLQDKDRSKYKASDRIKPLSILPSEGRRGRVLSIAPSSIEVDINDVSTFCKIRGTLKQEKTDQKNLVAVGDFVIIDEENQITLIEERRSFLSRKENLSRRKEHLIATNIDQVLITASVEDPPLKPSLIDRYIIATIKGNMSPVVVINKIDLNPNCPIVAELEKTYTDLGIPFIKVSAIDKTGFDALEKIMEGKSSVFSGQSGVGKTSLINDLTGSSYRTADVVEKTRKGSHTTTKAHLIKIRKGSFCVDTPGIKSFSLWDISSSELLSYFHDLQSFSDRCKFVNCTHRHEPDCAVREAAAEGKVSKLRYNSYLTIWENNDKDQKNPWD
jgi:ribosome biogenesis GTPase